MANLQHKVNNIGAYAQPNQDAQPPGLQLFGSRPTLYLTATLIHSMQSGTLRKVGGKMCPDPCTKTLSI